MNVRKKEPYDRERNTDPVLSSTLVASSFCENLAVTASFMASSRPPVFQSELFKQGISIQRYSSIALVFQPKRMFSTFAISRRFKWVAQSSDLLLKGNTPISSLELTSWGGGERRGDKKGKNRLPDNQGQCP